MVPSVSNGRPPSRNRPPPKQPEGRGSDAEEEATTNCRALAGRRSLRIEWRRAGPAESQVKRRRLRRQADDDFGDFTYLHEPIESEPKPPESRGRRAL